MQRKISILEQLSINCPDFVAVEIAEVNKIRPSFSVEYQDILSAIGAFGRLDENAVPSDSVYCFDSEAMIVEDMYTNFLKGILSISHNEFKITDIKESNLSSKLRSISFKYNDTEYIFEADSRGYLIDCGIIDFFNTLLEREENPKRLLCTSDNRDGFILFYNNYLWSRQFEDMTSIPLSLSSNRIIPMLPSL